MSNFSIKLNADEKAAFRKLAASTFPEMKKGAQAALFRQWLYKASEASGIAIENKSQYGGSREIKSRP